VDAKISSQKISEVAHNHQSEKEVYAGVSICTMDTRTVNTASLIDSSQEELNHSSSQLIKNSSATVGSLQKKTNQTSGSSDRSMKVKSSNPTEVANEVILFEGDLMFLDNNASLSLSTETSSSFVPDPPLLATQLSSPLVVTSQPSVCKAGTSQVMAITVPGNSDTQHGAATLTGIPLYPPPEQAVPQYLVTTGLSQAVGTVASPGPQIVNSTAQQQNVLPMSTVIMCGNDGLIPQFISIPYLESCKCVAVVRSDCQGIK
jgi:hypothetical protein